MSAALFVLVGPTSNTSHETLLLLKAIRRGNVTKICICYTRCGGLPWAFEGTGEKTNQLNAFNNLQVLMERGWAAEEAQSLIKTSQVQKHCFQS